jgi:2-polyprenyl-3-methyl-5-hydroxy-6-metoxy-1,4-benzoquinol methylase
MLDRAPAPRIEEVMADQLLPDALTDLWETVDEQLFTGDQFYSEQQRLLELHRDVWREALVLNGYTDLRESLLRELGEYVGCNDLNELERRCSLGWKQVEEEWQERVNPSPSAQAIEQFYDRTEAYLYNLIWWHTLVEDDTPLAYVLALRFAQQRQCRRYLDFGAGISSGTILFARHGFEVASADISSSLIKFSDWRFAKRGIPALTVDLKTSVMPAESFDLIAAMDVFEHLVDGVAAVDQIAGALAPGGFLYGRFAAEPDDVRPQHIAHDFEPVFRRLSALGFEKVWEDGWLWGHQVFQKPGRRPSRFAEALT